MNKHKTNYTQHNVDSKSLSIPQLCYNYTFLLMYMYYKTKLMKGKALR